jgi:hypothetical protein
MRRRRRLESIPKVSNRPMSGLRVSRMNVRNRRGAALRRARVTGGHRPQPVDAYAAHP